MIHIVTADIVKDSAASRRQAEKAAIEKCLEALGITPDTLAHAPTGKPYLTNSYAGANISISHSPTVAAVAVAPVVDGPFGIDIENINRSQFQRVLPRILSVVEQTFVLNPSEPLNLARAWTAKEAVFKAVSSSEIDFARHISIDSPAFDKATFAPAQQVFNLSFTTLPHDNILCLASQCNNFKLFTL